MLLKGFCVDQNFLELLKSPCCSKPCSSRTCITRTRTQNQPKNVFNHLRQVEQGFSSYLPHIWWFFKVPLQFRGALHCEKSSIMAKIWQKMKEILVRLAIFWSNFSQFHFFVRFWLTVCLEVEGCCSEMFEVLLVFFVHFTGEFGFFFLDLTSKGSVLISFLILCPWISSSSSSEDSCFSTFIFRFEDFLDLFWSSNSLAPSNIWWSVCKSRSSLSASLSVAVKF